MILVFGKSGQVATELQKYPNVIALGRSEADLTNASACAKEILLRRPAAVINAAAYTAVDKAEDEEDLATLINGVTPGAMARVCGELDIPFLDISTDYVFAGDGQTPWVETDPVAPQNAYGRSKLAGEKAVMSAGGKAAILRTSWVFSADGANFVKTMMRLSKTHKTLNVVDDQIGGPTPAEGISRALLQVADAMIAGQAGGIYHYAGEPQVSWADFAKEVFRQSGTHVDVQGIPSIDYPTPAQRPLNSRLDCNKIKREFGISTPNWQDALNQVLLELKETTI